MVFDRSYKYSDNFQIKTHSVMLPLPQRIRKNWAVMGYLFGLVRQIDPDLKFMVDTFTLVGFLWFSKRFLGLFCQIYSGESCLH